MNTTLKFLFVLGVGLICFVALTPVVTTPVFLVGVVGIVLVWVCSDKMK